MRNYDIYSCSFIYPKFVIAFVLVFLLVLGVAGSVFALDITFARQDDLVLEGMYFDQDLTAFADLNGDGYEDFAAVKHGNNEPETDPYLSINLRNADSSYQAQILYDSGYYTDIHTGICISDLNSDGNLDIAVTCHNDYATPKGRIDYFLGNGDGTFGARQIRNSVEQIRDIVAGDFNQDGYMDLAVTRYTNTNVVAVHYGLVDGSYNFTGFSDAYSFLSTTVTYSTDLVTGDFNDDGWPDLAVNNLNQNIYILNNSQSTEYSSFPTSTSLPISATYANASGAELVCADFDGDGNQDLAIAGPAVYVKLGHGDGSFDASLQYGPPISPSYPSTGTLFESLVADDFNLDGYLDLVALSRYDSAWGSPIVYDDLYIFQGVGDGTFTNMLSWDLALGVSATPGCMKVVNFNDDGKPDLALKFTTNNHLVRLFNSVGAAPAPTVTAIDPVSGLITESARTVTITGTGFVAGAIVELNNNGATPVAGTSVTVVSPTEITCTFDLTGVTTNLNAYWDVKVTNPDTLTGTGANLFTVYRPNPSVTSITPNTGMNTGPVNVTVNGTNFVADLTTVRLYHSPLTPITATNVVVGSSSQLTCTFDLTGQTATSWNVAVLVTGAEMASPFLYDGFTITAPAPAPTVTAIDPVSGQIAGGTAVTISGTNFVNGATVTLGGSAATEIVVTNSTTITAVTPAHAAGAVDVVVTNPDTQYGTLAGGFTYEEPSGTAPVITAHPENQTKTIGEAASFSASASGDPTPDVQWQVSTNGGKRWQNLPGATASTYDIPAVTSDLNNYQYRAVFTNLLGSATTHAAVLTVNSGLADVSITQTGIYDSITNSITWKITLTNDGPHAAQGVVVKDTLINGTKLTSVNTAYAYKTKGRTVIANIGQLDVGTSTDIIIIEALVTRAPSPVENTAVVETTSQDNDLTNNSYTASVTIA